MVVTTGLVNELSRRISIYKQIYELQNMRTGACASWMHSIEEQNKYDERETMTDDMDALRREVQDLRGEVEELKAENDKLRESPPTEIESRPI